MKILVIGTGEIGKSVINLIEESKKHTVFKKDIEPLEIKEKIDIMHICIPFNDKFEDIVTGYMKKYNPGMTIIESTVIPGTTDSIYKKTKMKVLHSPVRGRHPDLVGGLKKFIKFVASPDKSAAMEAKRYYEGLGLNVEIFEKTVNTELGKLIETTYYAAVIAFHQDVERMCKKIGADFKEVMTRFSETQTIDIDHKQPRPVMFPGWIGGHCLMPNIKILRKMFQSDLLLAIERSNDMKKEDLVREGKWQA